MLEKALTQKELSALLGMTTFEIYKKLCWQIEADYDKVITLLLAFFVNEM